MQFIPCPSILSKNKVVEEWWNRKRKEKYVKLIIDVLILWWNPNLGIQFLALEKEKRSWGLFEIEKNKKEKTKLEKGDENNKSQSLKTHEDDSKKNKNLKFRTITNQETLLSMSNMKFH